VEVKNEERLFSVHGDTRGRVVLPCRAGRSCCRGFAGRAGVCEELRRLPPKGGNIINPAKTLDKKVLTANGIREPADIVGKMRYPGPAMTRFDEKAIPDGTAKAIAEYILKTFK